MVGGEDARWILLEEALDLHMQHLGLPDPFQQELRNALEPHQPGIMWLSDHAVMIHETPLGLAFDREEFNAVLAQIKPATLP